MTKAPEIREEDAAWLTGDGHNVYPDRDISKAAPSPTVLRCSTKNSERLKKNVSLDNLSLLKNLFGLAIWFADEDRD